MQDSAFFCCKGLHFYFAINNLLELFESEPISIFEEEVGEYIYSKKDDMNIKLVMTLSYHPREIEISIGVSETELINICFDKVTRLEKKDSNLLIYNEQRKEPYTVRFRPRFAFEEITF